ncbi:hypothetical protein KGF56_001820 [Candida oxycetoniae]|uniref:Uncharacterized protein n=1 Tax=Candida oxycetoniae TaxID=497107 RepID=A0AAI9SYD7_9ASCO|nr:uncharacterized protein KGF56_001820 [Candida oxycetoniae]KAI3405373.2 hypothetical protein KGF56_001820 [Candida oxycetoniae]
MNNEPSVKKLADIPQIDERTQYPVDQTKFHKREFYKTRGYYLAIYIEPIGSGSNKVIVYATDFTSNNQCCDGDDGEELAYQAVNLRLTRKQVVRLVVHTDKLKILGEQYESAFSNCKLDFLEMLEDPDNYHGFSVEDKVIIFAVTTQWRLYRGILEPYTYDHEILEFNDAIDQYLSVVGDLYCNIMKQNQYVSNNKSLIEKIVPWKYRQPQSPAKLPSSYESSQTLNVNFSSKQKNNAKTDAATTAPAPTTPTTPTPPTTTPTPSVIRNPKSNGDVPKMHTDIDSSEIVEIDDNTSNISLNSQIVPQKRSHEEANSTYYTLKDLRNMKMDIDNQYYSIRCRILGTIPSDWSLLCGKPMESSTEPLGDPIMHELELILSDVDLSSNTSKIHQDNLLSVYFNGPEILWFLNLECVEKAYISAKTLQDNIDLSKLSADSELDIDVYKVTRRISATKSIVVWKADLKYDRLLGK